MFLQSVYFLTKALSDTIYVTHIKEIVHVSAPRLVHTTLLSLFPEDGTWVPKHVVFYVMYVYGDIDSLIEIGRCNGLEMNVEKNKSNENFKTTIPSKNYDTSKATRECGIF